MLIQENEQEICIRLMGLKDIRIFLMRGVFSYIDNRIIKKIDELSNVTGRSQNELAEKAFQMLFADNLLYFIF
jgi:hypothetical protein